MAVITYFIPFIFLFYYWYYLVIFGFIQNIYIITCIELIYIYIYLYIITICIENPIIVLSRDIIFDDTEFSLENNGRLPLISEYGILNIVGKFKSLNSSSIDSS